MAYLDDFLTQFSTSGATSYVLTLPDHVANDILVVAANADGGVTLSVGTSGWAQIGVTQISASASSSGIWWKRAAGSSETCTITMGTADAINVSMFVIKDVDTTTAIDVTNNLSTSSSAVFSTASTFTSESVTTTTADCLVLYYLGIEPPSTTPISALTIPGPTHFIDSSDAGGTTTTTMTGSACAWYIQRAAGATPTPTWDLSASSITHRFVIAFRNVSGGVVPPYIDDVDTLGEKLSTCSWYLSATTLNNENYPTALTYANIGPNGAGQATTYDAPAAVVDSGFNPYSSAINSTPASTTTNAIGYQRNFPTTAINMTTGWIVGGFKASTSKMALYNQGNIKKGGTYLVIGQGSNYRSYRVMARDNQDGNGVGFSVISVQANQTQTQYGYSSTSPTITAIDKMLILHKGQNATGAFYYTDWHFIKKVTVAGGTSASPVNAQGLFDVGRYCRIPLIAKSGASGLLAYVPIQIGGGDAVNFQIDAGALQFPRISSLADREINYHGANNAIGISYSGKSGDVIKHTNSVVTSPSPYYWEINSAATSAATWDFTGLLIVGANVTLRNVMTFDSMGFTSCPTLIFTDCTVTSGNIKNVPSGNDTLTTNSSTVISSSTINVTGVASGNRWCSVASPVIFANNIFTGSASTGHAIRITTPGTYALVGNAFTSFGADGTNSAAIFNDSGGLVTLNISGGGNTPTIRNGTGASTTVNNNVTITITVKDESNNNIQNARVAIQGSSTSAMFGAVADDGGVQTVQTTASNNITTNDMTLLPAVPAVNDAYYFGSAEPFYKFTVNIGQNGSGTWTVIWEYYNGSTWSTITDASDGTNGFRAGTGNKDVTFSPPSNWVTTSVQSIPAFWVRARVSAYTSVTAQPLGTQSWNYMQIMNELTTVGGVATESFNYSADTAIIIRIRKSATGSTKYIPANTTGTITSSGFSLTQILIQDNIAAA